MNYTALFKALKFACLPTLSILVLLFFGFFSITKTIDFISSDSAWAIFLRVAACVAEIVVVYIMYKEYEKQDIINKPSIEGKKTKYNRSGEFRQLFNHTDSSDEFFVYDTKVSNIKVVERKTTVNL